MVTSTKHTRMRYRRVSSPTPRELANYQKVDEHLADRLELLERGERSLIERAARGPLLASIWLNVIQAGALMLYFLRDFLTDPRIDGALEELRAGMLNLHLGWQVWAFGAFAVVVGVGLASGLLEIEPIGDRAD